MSSYILIDLENVLHTFQFPRRADLNEQTDAVADFIFNILAKEELGNVVLIATDTQASQQLVLKWLSSERYGLRVQGNVRLFCNTNSSTINADLRLLSAMHCFAQRKAFSGSFVFVSNDTDLFCGALCGPCPKITALLTLRDGHFSLYPMNSILGYSVNERASTLEQTKTVLESVWIDSDFETQANVSLDFVFLSILLLGTSNSGVKNTDAHGSGSGLLTAQVNDSTTVSNFDRAWKYVRDAAKKDSTHQRRGLLRITESTCVVDAALLLEVLEMLGLGLQAKSNEPTETGNQASPESAEAYIANCVRAVYQYITARPVALNISRCCSMASIRALALLTPCIDYQKTIHEIMQLTLDVPIETVGSSAETGQSGRRKTFKTEKQRRELWSEIQKRFTNAKPSWCYTTLRTRYSYHDRTTVHEVVNASEATSAHQAKEAVLKALGFGSLLQQGRFPKGTNKKRERTITEQAKSADGSLVLPQEAKKKKISER